MNRNFFTQSILISGIFLISCNNSEYEEVTETGYEKLNKENHNMIF
ncbi:MAG: hypothetical protein LBC19_00985 [Tannerella sp.]|jgi:hypothetical protein|nr:hypothetical protein [Tannerella sp.]